MKKIIAFLSVIVILGVSFVMAYDLTDSDNDLLDRVEEKLMNVIDDESNGITAEVVVSYVNQIIDSRSDLSERQLTLFEVIVDDIAWEYEIGDYAWATEEAMTADMCYPDEYFDEEDQQCYYEEDENYDDETEYESGDFSWGEPEGDGELTAAYSVSGNTITLVSGQDDVKNQEVWNIFSALIPESARTDIARFELVDDPESDTSAHVEQIEGNNTKWLMNVNLASFYVDGVLEPEESYATLIHEFAHVLTLNKWQVRYYPETDDEALVQRFEDSCKGNLLQEGCLSSDAYLDDFIDAFWSDKDYLEKVRNEEASAYEDSPESFVTDYAGTNPGEDIAESFTYFVLRAKPEGNTIADQKLQFFYNYKKLDSLRKQIRSNLAALK